MRYTGKEQLWSAVDAMQVNKALAWFQGKDEWTILCAHGISDGPTRLPSHDDRFVDLATFRKQMEHLLSFGYEFITLTEGVKRIREGRPLNRAITLNFDDGLRTIVSLAYPVMRELGLKGCMYVITDMVGTEHLLWTDVVTMVCWYNRGTAPLVLEFPDRQHSFSLADDHAILAASTEIIGRLKPLSDVQRRQVMEKVNTLFALIPGDFIPEEYKQTTWDDLRSLDPTVMEVGSHTVSHPWLTTLNEKDLKREIVDAKSRLEKELGRPADHFCYPGGWYNAAVIECVGSAGHVSATMGGYTRNRRETPLHELRRFVLDPSLPRFKARMSGLETLVKSARRPLKWFRRG